MKKIIFLLTVIASLISNAQVNTETITPQLKGSGDLALDQDGNLYVADFGDFLSGGDTDGLPNSVWKLDTDFNLTEFSTGFVGASGNQFDNNGILYQSDIGNGSIYKIISGVRTFVTNTGIVGPVGLAFDSQDNLYVCNCSNNTIRKVTPAGVSTQFASGNAFFSCPNGMTVDENDNLYVVNFSNTNIVKITPSGTRSIIGNTPSFNGHIDYNVITKKLYIASIRGHHILTLDLEDSSATPQVIAGTGVSGNTNGNEQTATFRYPNGIAVTKTGDSIYVNTSTNAALNNLNPSLIRLITGALSSTVSVETVTLPYASLKTYPNPVNEEFTIEIEFTEKPQNLNLKIYSILGKEVQTFNDLTSEGLQLKTTFNVSKLAIGTYFYSLYDGSKKIIGGKFMK